jgi:metallo-beta-lactamase class B
MSSNSNEGMTMKRFSVAWALAMTGAGLVAAQAPQPATFNSPTVQAHVDAAKALAGSDLNGRIFHDLCDITFSTRDAPVTDKIPPPTKAFDQLYYVGINRVGAWALVTSSGIIQFDALDNTAEAKTYIEGGYRKLGLDPTQMKYLVITHAHGDHFGGAKYLQDTYHPRVIMSAADWDVLARMQPSANGVVPPAKDMTATDGQKLTLGNTTVTLYVTPGHTPGTLSAILPVSDNGAPHALSFWGGTGLPRTSADSLRQYALSASKFNEIGATAKVDGVISNHPYLDNTFIDGAHDKITAIAQRKPGEPNPWLVGGETYRRYMGVIMECTAAAQGRLEK